MKNQLLKTVGWTAIMAGAYMVYLGSTDDLPTTRKPDDNVIDAEFTIIEE